MRSPLHFYKEAISMTVKELIEQLQAFDPNEKVIVRLYGDSSDIVVVEEYVAKRKYEETVIYIEGE